jgi:hypothetical protein
VKRPAHCALAALSLAASACGKQTFLAAALLGTPQVANPIDPAQPIPAQTFAIAYLGTVDTSNPTKISSASIGVVKGASGTITFASVADLPMKDRGDGSYSLDSNGEPRLTYDFDAKQQYTLILTNPDTNEAFGAKLLPAPKAKIQEFQASQSKSWTAGQDFTVTRTDAANDGGRFLPAFVVVMEINPVSPTGLSLDSAVYSTLPSTSSDLLKFALSDDAYRKPTYTVPGAKLVKGKYYVVALLVIRYGLVSDNTFLGSTALAGTGDAGLLTVQ